MDSQSLCLCNKAYLTIYLIHSDSYAIYKQSKAKRGFAFFVDNHKEYE
jgi:hypothetical protein